jgi:hypothetical protein
LGLTILGILAGLAAAILLLGLSRPVACSITITSGGKAVSQIQMGGAPLALRLTVKGTSGAVLPTPASPLPTWDTDNHAIATAAVQPDATVQITPVAPGTCNVTATDAIGGAGAVLTAATYPVTVEDVPASISIGP